MTEQTPVVRERVNATKRLYSYLAAVEQSNQGSMSPVIDMMTVALGMPENKGAEADCQVIARTVDLLRRSEREIRTFLPQDLPFCVRSFEPLYRFFGPRTCMSPWTQVRQNLREKYLTDIENTGQRLTGLVPELSLQDDEFREVREALEELWSAMQNSSLSEEVRSTLLSRFRELQRAVEDYRHVGAAGIREAFESAIGTMAMDARVRSELQNDEKVGGSVLKIVRRIGIATLWLLATANTVHDAQKNFAPVVQQLFLEAPQPQAAPANNNVATQLLVAEEDPGLR